MTTKTPRTIEKVYIVANPRGIPAGIPVFRQMVGGELRGWYEGDTYDGPSSDEPLRRGFLEVKGG